MANNSKNKRKRRESRNASGNARANKKKISDKPEVDFRKVPLPTSPLPDESTDRDSSADDSDSNHDEFYLNRSREYNIDLTELDPNVRTLIENKLDQIQIVFNEAVESLHDSYADSIRDLHTQIENLEKSVAVHNSKTASEQPVDCVANTIVIQGLAHSEGENVLVKVSALLDETFGGIGASPEIVQVVRYTTYNPERPGIIKVAFEDLKTKKSVLHKKYNKISECYKNIIIRSSKSHIERVMEKNMRLLLWEMGLENKYKLNGYGKIVLIDNKGQKRTQKPMDQSAVRNSNSNQPRDHIQNSPKNIASANTDQRTLPTSNRGKGGIRGRGAVRGSRGVGRGAPQRQLPLTPQTQRTEEFPTRNKVSGPPPNPLPPQTTSRPNVTEPPPNRTSTPMERQTGNGARQKQPVQPQTGRKYKVAPPLKTNAAVNEPRTLQPVNATPIPVVPVLRPNLPESETLPSTSGPQTPVNTQPIGQEPQMGTYNSAPRPDTPYPHPPRNMFSEPPPLMATPEIIRGSPYYDIPYAQQQQNWYLNDPCMYSPYQVEATDQSVLEWEQNRRYQHMNYALNSPEYPDIQDVLY